MPKKNPLSTMAGRLTRVANSAKKVAEKFMEMSKFMTNSENKSIAPSLSGDWETIIGLYGDFGTWKAKFDEPYKKIKKDISELKSLQKQLKQNENDVDLAKRIEELTKTISSQIESLQDTANALKKRCLELNTKFTAMSSKINAAQQTTGTNAGIIPEPSGPTGTNPSPTPAPNPVPPPPAPQQQQQPQPQPQPQQQQQQQQQQQPQSTGGTEKSEQTPGTQQPPKSDTQKTDKDASDDKATDEKKNPPSKPVDSEKKDKKEEGELKKTKLQPLAISLPLFLLSCSFLIAGILMPFAFILFVFTGVFSLAASSEVLVDYVETKKTKQKKEKKEKHKKKDKHKRKEKDKHRSSKRDRQATPNATSEQEAAIQSILGLDRSTEPPHTTETEATSETEIPTTQISEQDAQDQHEGQHEGQQEELGIVTDSAKPLGDTPVLSDETTETTVQEADVIEITDFRDVSESETNRGQARLSEAHDQSSEQIAETDTPEQTQDQQANNNGDTHVDTIAEDLPHDEIIDRINEQYGLSDIFNPDNIHLVGRTDELDSTHTDSEQPHGKKGGKPEKPKDDGIERE